MRRNPRGVPLYPGMVGASPLLSVNPNTPINPLSLQVAAHAEQYNNHMYGSQASLLGASALYNPNPNQILARYYPPNSPGLVGHIGAYPYGHLNPYYGLGSGCQTCGGAHDSCCEHNDNSQEQKFKTKDVTVRGKARKVRASFLIEASKFEADLVKYMDKKKEDDVPDKVVDMLISYINHEDYKNSNILDEITMNILASNVGAKSAVLHSAARFRKLEDDINPRQITKIIGTVFLSSKVDDSITKWLKSYLKDEDRYNRLFGYYEFRELCEERPEVLAELERLLGLKSQPDDRWSRSL